MRLMHRNDSATSSGPLRWIIVAIALHMTLAGCQAFRPQLESAPRTGDELETEAHIGYLARKQTVEIEGRWSRGVFIANRIEIREPDDEIEIKSRLERLDMKRLTGKVGEVSFLVAPDARIVDSSNQPVAADRFVAGTFVKAELTSNGRQLVLQKIQLRERREGERDEVQGEIERIDYARSEIDVGGIVVRFSRGTAVTWELATPPTFDASENLRRTFSYRRPGLPRIRNVDDDDVRPNKQLQIGENATLGGEIQYDAEYRGNHDLKDVTDRDRLLHEAATKLELSVEIANQIYGFAQGRIRRKFVHFDQDRDLDHDTQYRLGETFLYIEDRIAPGVALQLGRQDFDQGREWVMDELLDAARLYFNLGTSMLEVSASMLTFGGGDDDEGVKNFLLGLHSEPIRDTRMFTYALHRHGGTAVKLERTHLGISLEGRRRSISYWGDAGYATGTEDDQRVRGYGIDVATMFAPRDQPLRPSIYVGYAYGSGDRDRNGGVDRNFRQSGLHDNNDKFNGVTSFRYLGELVRPDLSNLQVWTVGTGFRPSRRTSIDLVYHNYRQVEAANFFEGSRLRQMPTGGSADIGDEIDLILGIEDYFPLEVELVAAYFAPGSAFAIRDDAWFAAVKMEWNF